MKQTPEEALAELQQSVQSLFLSTLTKKEGVPNASYAPFICDNANNFYLFVSQLAPHTADLQANPQASILLIEDEKDCRQIFARKRLSYSCYATVVEKKEANYEGLLDQFDARFANMIPLLRTLPDFILFKLSVESGSFVQGFGQAFKIDQDGSLIHHDPRKDNDE
ncbi:MAG: pyridoxamine 5'-phosphate oxidase family protein [Cocleimonas sp.]|nr:pyridoxamine 5'-phosphate oxidase family protein [Cocleimonas sp.]